MVMTLCLGVWVPPTRYLGVWLPLTGCGRGVEDPEALVDTKAFTDVAASSLEIIISTLSI